MTLCDDLLKYSQDKWTQGDEFVISDNKSGINPGHKNMALKKSKATVN